MNGNVTVYATAKLKELTRVQHDKAANGVCFTPDSKSIVTAGNDNNVIV
jgi:WD40 repeat protein